MKTFLFVAVICLLAASTVAGTKTTKWYELTNSYSFAEYQKEFNKVYESETEKVFRKRIFEERLKAVLLHNADPSQTYKRGVNHFTDHTLEELKNARGLHKGLLYQGHHERRKLQQVDSMKLGNTSSASLPETVDWRTKNVLTPIKNQGQCGSCWTFASTETLESQWALKTGILQELSEQFILDCTPNPHQCGGTGGCGGGTAELAYTELVKRGGMPSEYTYPYISGTGKAGQCHGVPLKPATPHTGEPMASATLKGHVSVTSNSYDAVMDAVANVGPLAVSVDAGAWHDYESGVFSGGNQTSPTLDHLVQLVGYGSDKQLGDYWIIRNSWTPLWGEDGFMLLKRYSDEEHCGVDVNPLDGNGCKGGPPTVTVCGQNGVLYDAVYPVV
jgi:cathepsin L